MYAYTGTCFPVANVRSMETLKGQAFMLKEQLEIYLINCLWEGLQVRERSHSEK
jgi:hypothetical protein